MSAVPINDVFPRTQAIATPSQAIYTATWTANYYTDVVVYSRPANTPANDATQILDPSTYTVAFIGGSNIVQVTLNTPSTVGDVVTLTRQTPANRLNLYTNVNFTPSMLNQDFGILTLVDQQAQLVNQVVAPRYNYSAFINPNPSYPNCDTILPVLAANQVWSKNAGNTAIIGITLGSASAINATNPSLPYVASTTGAYTVGHILVAGDALGTLADSGTYPGGLAAINAYSFLANTTGSSAVPISTLLSTILQSANNLSDLTSSATALVNLGLGTPTGTGNVVLNNTPSITTPRISTAILDSNGLNILGLSATASAVNFFQLSNSATGQNPVFSLGGTDSTIQMNIESKGGVFNFLDSTTTNGAQLSLFNAAQSHYVGFKAPTTLSGNQIWTLPGADGTSGYVLSTNGSGVLSWVAGGSGSGTVNSGSQYQLAYYAANGTAVSGLSSAANGTLVTNGSSVPSISSTLPAAVQGNITALGTIATGVWQGTPVTVTYGGTGAASFTAYSVICGGTTGTGAFQNVSGLGTSGQVLTSNGNGALPTWQAGGGGSSPWTAGAGTDSAYGGGATANPAYYALLWGNGSSIGSNATNSILLGSGGSIGINITNAIQLGSGSMSGSSSQSINIGNGLVTTNSNVINMGLNNTISGQYGIGLGAGLSITGVQAVGILYGSVLADYGVGIGRGFNILSGHTGAFNLVDSLQNTNASKGANSFSGYFAGGYWLYTGSSGNILSLVTSTTDGAVNILRDTTATAYPAGTLGQVIPSVILQGSSISLTTATSTDLTSISLPAGNWKVNANIMVQGTTVVEVSVWTSSTSATAPDLAYQNRVFSGSGTSTGLSAPEQIYNLSSTTTIYASVYATLTGSGTACGRLVATRI